MRIDAIPIGFNPPEDVNVIVEVPIGGEPIKYEMNKEAGTLFVDRFLHTPMRYPGNYGFVPHTLSDDGDPIDVLVANTRPIVPGAVINVRPVGVLKMEDEAGGDEKIIAVPAPRLTKRYLHITNYDQLPAMAQQRMLQERPWHTLQATALVHEAFLKLVGPREIPWAGQGHFYAAAAEAMRRILVDHARTRQRDKV